MKELPRKLKGFVVAHGPQSLIVLVGAVALVVSGMFLLGNPVFGLTGEPTASDGAQAEVQTSDSVASIKDKDGDADGLSDLEERLYHTNPAKEDTDGDGYKDGEEVDNGYDPASKLSAGAEATGAGAQSSASILSVLGSGSTDTSGVGGMGGLGGFSAEQTQQLNSAVLPDGQRLADLEVDQILNNGSQPLPTVTAGDIKTSDDTSMEAEQAYADSVARIVIANNPFPKGYSVKAYLDDVGANNRALFEDMKFSAETMLQQMQELKVPKSMLEEHAHALGILLAARDSLQQVLAANASSDAVLALLGRSFFVIGEIRALLEDAQLELAS